MDPGSRLALAIYRWARHRRRHELDQPHGHAMTADKDLEKLDQDLWRAIGHVMVPVHSLPLENLLAYRRWLLEAADVIAGEVDRRLRPDM